MRSTEEKIKRKVISVVIIVAILSTMAGCGKSQSRKEPITLTIWHVYGGQTDSPLNDLIDEFNGTEGKKEGIKIQVGMVSNTNTIHEEVLKAVEKCLKTGTVGDGKCFVTEVVDVLRIRTGERGVAALMGANEC